MLEHISHLKELLDYFTFMNDKVSSHLVVALLPLIRLSRDLQDYTILVLCKAMFRREDSIRLAATSSIFNLILAEKQSKKDGPFSCQDSSSQASSSQQAEVFHALSSSLFQELSGLLLRCLYQQVKVREILYRGLLKLVLVDPLSSVAVFDFLFPHFLRSYREDADVLLDVNQRTKSENGKVYIQEPLDCLLSCISWMLLLQPHGKTDHPSDSWTCFGFSLTQENEQLSLNHPTAREILGLPQKDPQSTAAPPKSGEIKTDPSKKQRKVSVQNLSPHELANLSVKFLAGGRRDEAMSFLRLALANDPEYVRALLIIGQTLLQDGSLPETLSQSDIDQRQAYYEAVGGEKKRRVYGLGYQAISYKHIINT